MREPPPAPAVALDFREIALAGDPETFVDAALRLVEWLSDRTAATCAPR